MKKIDNMIKYYIPGRFCAPEQCKVFVGKFDITPKNYQERTDIGYALYTDKQKAEKLIKQFIRQKTNISKKIEKRLLAIRTDDGNYICLPHGFVDRFDIKEKLQVFKDLKKSYQENRCQTEITTAKLDGNYKPVEVKKETIKPELLDRVTFLKG